MLDSTRIQAKILGLQSRTLMKRKAHTVPSGAANAMPIFVREARGALVTDVGAAAPSLISTVQKTYNGVLCSLRENAAHH